VEFENTFKTLNEESRLSFKLDGFNIQVNYYNGEAISAETRGRTGNSLNADIVRKIVPKRIPLKGKVKVTGEVVIPNTVWSMFKLETGNSSQRNSVATALARGMADYLEFVAFNIQTDTEKINGDLYDVLTSYGFKVPFHRNVANYKQLLAAMKYFELVNKNYRYPNDGLVIENSAYQLAIRVGGWKEECMKSYVMGYEEKVGAYGVAMSVNIKPVEYDGAVKRNVSVTNLQYIIDSNLQIGSPIAFDNRSMTTSVLNVSRTADLQEQYAGHFEDYRAEIDAIAKS
jgi:NAD-dependent DNA ligase